MSSQLTERGSLDVESEMLPQEPSPGIIRSTAWILLAAFLFALLVAIVMRLPESVHCQFVLIPATGADPIQSPRQAIISHVAVEEGQPVKLGETLFVLRSDEIRGWDMQFRTLTEDLRSKEESLGRSETAYAAQAQIKNAEIEQAKSEVKFRQNHREASQDLVARMQKLATQGGVSQVDLVKLKLDLAGSEKDFSVAQRTLQQVNLDWISPSAITASDGSHFVALGSLDRSVISPRPGQVLPLRVGMKGEAHIIVGGRTLIEYAFEPIRQLRESVRQ